MHLSQVGWEGAHKGERYLERLEGGGRSPGRKGALQLPSADADKARLYIVLLLRGQLYHHLWVESLHSAFSQFCTIGTRS